MTQQHSAQAVPNLYPKAREPQQPPSCRRERLSIDAQEIPGAGSGLSLLGHHPQLLQGGKLRNKEINFENRVPLNSQKGCLESQKVENY